MTRENEWQKFFDGHAPVYLDNSFTKNTLEEVDFLLAELHLPLDSHILDIGCGPGRHAIELARRGYRVTGVDISSHMLARGAQAAAEAGVKVKWIQADATRFRSRAPHDAAICLCEGAFGLLACCDDPLSHDLAILQNIHVSLKAEAGLILTATNGYRLIRRYTPEDIAKDLFDPLTMVETYAMEYDTPQGNRSVQLRERGHLPTELHFLLTQVGFDVEHIGGGTAGQWRRRPLELDEMEIMVIARKIGQAHL